MSRNTTAPVESDVDADVGASEINRVHLVVTYHLCMLCHSQRSDAGRPSGKVSRCVIARSLFNRRPIAGALRESFLPSQANYGTTNLFVLSEPSPAIFTALPTVWVSELGSHRPCAPLHGGKWRVWWQRVRGRVRPSTQPRPADEDREPARR